MNIYKPTYKPFGESAILIEWPSRIDEEIIQDIVAFEKKIEKDENVLDTIIAYNSLTIRYRILKNFNRAVVKLNELYAMERKQEVRKQKVWQIPVCYNLKFGLDLEEISSKKSIAVDEVIRLHTAPEYLIYFLGFQPGFLYLGGLNSQIHMPRRSNPRLRVEKGAVGIGGVQTGVYPQDSAGGWNIIGKSPIDFFDVTKTQPSFAKAGDRVKFQSIDLAVFKKIQEEVSEGIYKLKFQWI
ncbi:5-oxoprolinase subunit PxpB [Flavobacteriaceae bacterium S356]|uniref:5-oxoprolinase subunit PxpB n=1 Tax=Asprobacillus argus TaxID=3076534 RepID=A0ABU3LH31_9FLAO|nr:5-oxoprolinase subunit PxpB [Flavobacteriaceae bacterium S356]